MHVPKCMQGSTRPMLAERFEVYESLFGPIIFIFCLPDIWFVICNAGPC